MKIIGSIIIIFSSIFASYFYEKSLKNSIRCVNDLIELIKAIKNKIEYYSLSVDDILNQYTPKSDYIKQVLTGEEATIMYIDESVNKDIKAFFVSLGKGYKKEQLLLCEYTLKSLQDACEKINTEFSKKAKIFRSLSLFLGVSIIIILV